MSISVGESGALDGAAWETEEREITERGLQSEALNGRYYQYDKHSWQSLGWVEWLIRVCLGGILVDSVRTACLRYSWVSIEKMPNLPVDIARRAEDLFLDSLVPTNARSAHSTILSRIFCRTIEKTAREERRNLEQIQIRQQPNARSFRISYQGQLRYLVANSRGGQLDFYTPAWTEKWINEQDSLWNGEGSRVGAVKLAVDYAGGKSPLNVCMELCSGKDQRLAFIEANKEKVTLAFREAMTHQLLAVGNFSRVHGSIHWTLTLIQPATLEEKQITPLLLALATLKYSQHYHFPSPLDLPYVEGLPQSM